MDEYTISAAIGMWRSGAKWSEIAHELNLCAWEAKELVEIHIEKLIRNEIFVQKKGEDGIT